MFQNVQGEKRSIILITLLFRMQHFPDTLRSNFQLKFSRKRIWVSLSFTLFRTVMHIFVHRRNGRITVRCRYISYKSLVICLYLIIVQGTCMYSVISYQIYLCNHYIHIYALCSLTLAPKIDVTHFVTWMLQICGIWRDAEQCDAFYGRYKSNDRLTLILI